MIKELSTLCEQNKLSLNIDYTPTEEVWSIDIDDNKVNVYNSFIYKGSIVILLQNAYNAAIEYVKKRRNKQLELFWIWEYSI